jgi:hypothetical protein
MIHRVAHEGDHESRESRCADLARGENPRARREIAGRSATRIHVDLRPGTPARVPPSVEHASDVVEAGHTRDDRTRVDSTGREEIDGSIEAG